MKDIVREGHPTLRETAKDVNFPLDEKDKQLLEDMVTFLKNSQDDELAEKYQLRTGVGIAAPQLGISKRFIAVYFKDQNEKIYNYKLVNPRIISHSVEKAYLATGEGCLSVDRNVDGYVLRYSRITVEAFDESGEKIKLRLRGYPAIVIQHEIDHLNGIMFFDHINKDNPYMVVDNAKAIE